MEEGGRLGRTAMVGAKVRGRGKALRSQGHAMVQEGRERAWVSVKTVG